MTTSLAEGQTIGGRYIVQCLLGTGGMAAVYHAFDIQLDLDVALKVLTKDLASDPNFVARFRREGRMMAQLSHPHVPRFYTNGQDPATGLYYLVLEYLTGGTLRDQLQGRPWSLDRALPMLTFFLNAPDSAEIYALSLLDARLQQL